MFIENSDNQSVKQSKSMFQVSQQNAIKRQNCLPKSSDDTTIIIQGKKAKEIDENGNHITKSE